MYPRRPAGLQDHSPVLGGRVRRRGPPEKKGSAPQALQPFRHHGGMDHFGEAAGGGCPAALYHDWKVRL